MDLRKTLDTLRIHLLELACGLGYRRSDGGQIAMSVRQYPEEIKRHKNEWVALSPDDQLVGYGKTPEEAVSSAKASGKNFTLVYIPDEWPGLMML